ncbi:protein TRIGALACTOSYLDIACYLGLYCEROL 5, chloroplastic-like [Papaver somniferum]|uniref:protein TRIGALACTOSYLDIACYLGLYCEROL 5, chloroplastic-like n=1 Tax=Papaver somniferum TaxID=3469 RepID=UPI000E6FD95D|nr:protein TRIGALACTOSYLDIACYLGLYCEROL 5, chloroplastic-like [Papaver somniferum]
MGEEEEIIVEEKIDNNLNNVKGFLWKFPVFKTRELGKLGPAFGLGVGCGVGFGVGFLGGLGIGPGLSSKLQLGVGFGAGCGVGIGFGYGMGKGVAQDDSGRHANLGRLSRQNGKLPFRYTAD